MNYDPTTDLIIFAIALSALWLAVRYMDRAILKKRPVQVFMRDHKQRLNATKRATK